MSESITVTGMVLSATPVGDYDKRMVLLTRERGKITVFARGARRSNSENRAVANTFVFGSFQVFEGRTAYTLGSASVREYFTELAWQQPGVYYGYYFLELADYYGREGNRETDMLNLLYITMKALLNHRISNPLIRVIFEWKMLGINGEYPQIFECSACGKKTELAFFSMAQPGCLCRDCAPAYRDAVRISPTALYTLQYIITSPIDKLYTFTVPQETERELAGLVGRYMERYTDKKFKSLEILKVME